MLYTFPDYYREFSCVGGSCPDTCCAGWQIMIDEKSMKRYRRWKGAFGSRLQNSIDWKEGCFRQYKGRCVFLNEENLCDLYIEDGKNGFCRTCRNYPRHEEEFEGVREISLSLSCPQVCRMILEKQDKVRFISGERKTKDEVYDFFDYILYSKLCDLRKCMIGILQNRALPVRLRASMVLALAHDAQGHIRKKESYAVDDLIEKYSAPGAWKRFSSVSEHRLEAWRNEPGRREETDSCFIRTLQQLEPLREIWPEYLNRIADTVMSPVPALDDIQLEQLLVYYIFVYLAGAVYDEEIFPKVQLAVFCSFMTDRLIRFGFKVDESSQLDLFTDVAHSLSRELEHSDDNLKAMEREFKKNPVFCLESMLAWLNN